MMFGIFCNWVVLFFWHYFQHIYIFSTFFSIFPLIQNPHLGFLFLGSLLLQLDTYLIYLCSKAHPFYLLFFLHYPHHFDQSQNLKIKNQNQTKKGDVSGFILAVSMYYILLNNIYWRAVRGYLCLSFWCSLLKICYFLDCLLCCRLFPQ